MPGNSIQSENLGIDYSTRIPASALDTLTPAKNAVLTVGFIFKGLVDPVHMQKAGEKLILEIPYLAATIQKNPLREDRYDFVIPHAPKPVVHIQVRKDLEFTQVAEKTPGISIQNCTVPLEVHGERPAESIEDYVRLQEPIFRITITVMKNHTAMAMTHPHIAFDGFGLFSVVMIKWFALLRGMELTNPEDIVLLSKFDNLSPMSASQNTPAGCHTWTQDDERMFMQQQCVDGDVNTDRIIYFPSGEIKRLIAQFQAERPDHPFAAKVSSFNVITAWLLQNIIASPDSNQAVRMMAVVNLRGIFEGALPGAYIRNGWSNVSTPARPAKEVASGSFSDLVIELRSAVTNGRNPAQQMAFIKHNIRTGGATMLHEANELVLHITDWRFKAPPGLPAGVTWPNLCLEAAQFCEAPQKLPKGAGNVVQFMGLGRLPAGAATMMFEDETGGTHVKLTMPSRFWQQTRLASLTLQQKTN